MKSCKILLANLNKPSFSDKIDYYGPKASRRNIEFVSSFTTQEIDPTILAEHLFSESYAVKHYEFAKRHINTFYALTMLVTSTYFGNPILIQNSFKIISMNVQSRVTYIICPSSKTNKYLKNKKRKNYRKNYPFTNKFLDKQNRKTNNEKRKNARRQRANWILLPDIAICGPRFNVA